MYFFLFLKSSFTVVSTIHLPEFALIGFSTILFLNHFCIVLFPKNVDKSEVNG